MTGRRRLDALQSCVEDILDNNVPRVILLEQAYGEAEA